MIPKYDFSQLNNVQIADIINQLQKLSIENSKELINTFISLDLDKLNQYLSRNDNTIPDDKIDELVKTLPSKVELSHLPFFDAIKGANSGDKLVNNYLKIIKHLAHIINNPELIPFFHRNHPGFFERYFEKNCMSMNRQQLYQFIELNIIDIHNPELLAKFKEKIYIIDEGFVLELIKNKTILFTASEYEALYLSKLLSYSKETLDTLVELNPSISKLNLHELLIKQMKNYGYNTVTDMRKKLVLTAEPRLSYIWQRHPLNISSLNIFIDVFTKYGKTFYEENHYKLDCRLVHLFRHIRVNQPELISYISQPAFVEQFSDMSPTYAKIMLTFNLTNTVLDKDKAPKKVKQKL